MNNQNKIDDVLNELRNSIKGEIDQLDVLVNAFDLNNTAETHDALIKITNKLNDVAGDCLLLSRASNVAQFNKKYYIYSAKEIIENPDVTFMEEIPLVRWHVDGVVGVINKYFLDQLIKFVKHVRTMTEYEVEIIGGYIPATKRYESDYYGKLMKDGKSCLMVFSRKDNRRVAESKVATQICKEYVQMYDIKEINFDVHNQQVLMFTHPNVKGQVNINNRGFFKQGKNLL